MKNLSGGYVVKRWVIEDWSFEMNAVDGKAADCRLSIEKGDKL